MKNQKIRKFISIILTLAIFTAITGCGKDANKQTSNPNVLNICMPDLGYGTEWMKAVTEAFTAKTGYKVKVDVTPTETNYVTAMRAGKAPYDIYVMRGNTYDLVASNAANFSGYDCILAELDDVYEAEIEPGVKFKDKMKDVYEIYNRVDVKGTGEYHYYAVQWCDSVFSLVRNMKVWKDSWTVPNTTDELIALANQIKADGKIPFIWSSQASYWWQAANIWVTQYQGLEDMYGAKGFWNGYDEKGNQNVPEMWRRNGILEAMKVLDTLVRVENKYQHTLSTTENFTTVQGYFLTESNGIAMMANGDWLYKEMKKNYSSATIDMIKMPVVSAIINHPDCEGTIQDDEELSALIAAIDSGATAIEGKGYNVSQKAFNKVKEARELYTCASNINHIMVSPVYSDSLDIVKEFYKYLASDEGLVEFTKGSGGFTLCFDTSEKVMNTANEVANDFVKSTLKLKKGTQVAPWPVYSSRLFSLGGMTPYPTIETGYQYPELIFSLERERLSAEELYLTNYRNAQAKWSVFMQNAGLK